jgi:hypothetical protein
VRDTAGAQVLAHREAGLTSTDDEDLNLLARHTNLHSERQKSAVPMRALRLRILRAQ